MNSTQTVALIIGILLLLGILVFFVFKKGKMNSTETIEYPPFTIKKRNTYSTRYDINTNSRRDNSRSYYEVFYNKELIEFPSALSEGTGVSGLWKVYVLEDAPQPALLAGSKSIYLITGENNQYKLSPISENGSDFISMQWLDSLNGQPGNKQELYSSDDTDEEIVLKGGNHLLINKKIVLDIPDLKLYPFRVSSDLSNNYYANQVVGFSPDQDHVIYMGSHNEMDNQFALLVYNYKTNDVYAVPFDRTENRLHEPYRASSDWMNTCFEWQENEEGKEILKKRSLESPPPWQGHFSDTGFSVSPVKVDMLQVFVNYLKELSEIDGQKIEVKQGYSETNFDVNVSEHRMGISFFDDLQSVYFSVHFATDDEKACYEILQKIGNSFNERLNDGAHQDLFTSY